MYFYTSPLSNIKNITEFGLNLLSLSIFLHSALPHRRFVGFQSFQLFHAIPISIASIRVLARVSVSRGSCAHVFWF
jgi:hypothetical protein